MERHQKPDNNDEESIRPVSSLLSHFENLTFKRSTQSSASRNAQANFLAAPDAADIPVRGRASLDAPRPADSSWQYQRGFSSISRQTTGNRVNESSLGPGSPGRRGHARPMSMYMQPTAALAPALTVESPHSPRPAPRPKVTIPAVHYGSRSYRDRNDLSAPPAQSRTPYATSPRRPSIRPITPLIDGSGVLPESRRSIDRSYSSNGSTKSSSVPPPVNRAEKPKIPAKKPNVAAISTHTSSLAPVPQTITSDDRVSPFSTPPSSPEKPPPSTTIPNGQAGRRPPKPSYRDGVSNRLSQFEPASGSLDVKESLPSRTKPAPVPNRGAKPAPPPPPPMKRNAGVPAKPRNTLEPPPLQNLSDAPENRPGLPPRSRATTPQRESSLRPGLSSGKPSLGSAMSPSVGPTKQLSPMPAVEQRMNFPPPPRRDTAARLGRPLPEPVTQMARSPGRAEEFGYSSSASTQRPQMRPLRDDSEESEQVPEELPPSRTDYPNFSHSNRRLPVFRSGARAIHTKHDTRVFDVCGQYACTTGYFTKVWDLVTGEHVMNLSHGETLKGLSVCFKPGGTINDEGKLLWLGTSVGEIHEIDIATQSIVSSRSSPSRREIVKIHRHKKELWTLDDEGKLLIWPPDESGAPNLQYSYSHPYDRVAKGVTFSMVVGDLLWLATGKEVRIYQPNTKDAAFQVSKTPLGKTHTGDVTCGTTTPNDGGLVYLGHADGKVTIYSTKDFSYLGIVNVSLYKINCLAMVGDYLWAGYKTGMIYVYDTSTTPWTVKKDWHAHDHAVCGLALDPSAIWTVNKLQVVSLGVDNYIRLWDGMLEEDWLETKMQSIDVEYCQFREISAAVITWNAGATVPGNLRDNDFIRDSIHPENPPEILVFGFQELVDLEDKKLTAKSFLKGRMKEKDKDGPDKEHMSRRYRVWKDYLMSCINAIMPIDQSYVPLHTANLIGLFTCVFVKQEERQRITNVSAAEIKRGMGGLHGNKGALILRFILDDSSLCFINCHLAAGQTHTAQRNNDIAAILESESLPVEPSSSARIDLFAGGGDGSMILDHEICILSGDLNYRIDSIPRNTVIEAVKAHNLPKLLDRDQLLASKRKNPGFRLRSFNEAPITFAPTYKYDVGTDNFDTSEKKRAPAWCDRLLYRGFGRVKQTEYRRHEVRVSDHRPVSGVFKMRIKTISPKDRTAAWEVCQQEFLEKKRRLATAASIEYLVNILGIDPQEAKRLITSNPSS
ncbi:hypothetical protein AJ80_05467 [Polytolypa hystricis UAMH7299]|uniref:Inositol polyphosphate-related phosphatase domain-containing protein n=1 Tax=Polytolypa hystricis (strain UAMH7299) TaxID=1447883 RepID=A0A2B7Y3J8_POLH7|nr:hypothetical protein AJ80_05467 [Polytolypa hystricis UAMH7299]